MILVGVLSRVFWLCPVLLGCDSLCCLNFVLLGCCGSLGGLMGKERLTAWALDQDIECMLLLIFRNSLS